MVLCLLCTEQQCSCVRLVPLMKSEQRREKECPCHSEPTVCGPGSRSARPWQHLAASQCGPLCRHCVKSLVPSPVQREHLQKCESPGVFFLPSHSFVTHLSLTCIWVEKSEPACHLPAPLRARVQLPGLLAWEQPRTDMSCLGLKTSVHNISHTLLLHCPFPRDVTFPCLFRAYTFSFIFSLVLLR